MEEVGILISLLSCSHFSVFLMDSTLLLHTLISLFQKLVKYPGIGWYSTPQVLARNHGRLTDGQPWSDLGRIP